MVSEVGWLVFICSLPHSSISKPQTNGPAGSAALTNSISHPVCQLEENDNKQVAAFLYCMGEDTEDILAFTIISNEDRKKYDTNLKQAKRPLISGIEEWYV
jgi:hypothetical protein